MSYLSRSQIQTLFQSTSIPGELWPNPGNIHFLGLVHTETQSFRSIFIPISGTGK